MKTQHLFSMLVILMLVFGFSSCADEDNTIEISQLTGIWADVHEDYTTFYTFGSNNTCLIEMVGPLIDAIPVYCTYEISDDYKFITLKDKEGPYMEQYHIIKLTSNEMIWKDTKSGSENTEIHLEKWKE